MGYTVAAGLAKKKNPKTGDSLSLKGYKVGMRAPNTAKSSGTTQGEQSLWECLAARSRWTVLQQEMGERSRTARGSSGQLHKTSRSGLHDSPCLSVLCGKGRSVRGAPSALTNFESAL